MTALPQDFLDRMQDMLKEAYPAFLHSHEKERYQALRMNTLKGAAKRSCAMDLFGELKRVPWEQNGSYYPGAYQPGKHPLHEAGVYYIQEPSAMAPAAYLGARPGEHILDLCAAPGGKTGQIAADMQGEGILVCNEIHPARAKILSENVERMGIRNALVTNETPQRLSEAFEAYFDRILVDAPCSGEGMFRKSEEACAQWSLENVRACAQRQDQILDCADQMLSPGGRLVYSTCTFAPEEDEGAVARFMERHPGYQILECPLCGGMSPGVPAWAYGDGAVPDRDSLARTVRIFPHLAEGEGHFFAVLQKQGTKSDGYQALSANGVQKGIRADRVEGFLRFQEEALRTVLLSGKDERLLRFGGQIYLMPQDMPSMDGLKVLRAGLHLGTLKKDRFEPSHALALALAKEDVQRSAELGSEEQARSYLSGMTWSQDGEKGWYLITYMGYSIGWGKLAGQIMKNHYPKGLRR